MDVDVDAIMLDVFRAIFTARFVVGLFEQIAALNLVDVVWELATTA